MYIIAFIIIFNYENNHLINILSSLIVKFSGLGCPSQEILQVKFINCYFREYISFTTKMTLETGASLTYTLEAYEGRSICNENRPVNPEVLYLHTS